MLQDAVAVVGYPIGGDTISVTSGVVSRIEVTSYVHGSTELLGVQIDAAINSGNSGAAVNYYHHTLSLPSCLDCWCFSCNQQIPLKHGAISMRCEFPAFSMSFVLLACGVNSRPSPCLLKQYLQIKAAIRDDSCCPLGFLLKATIFSLDLAHVPPSSRQMFYTKALVAKLLGFIDTARQMRSFHHCAGGPVFNEVGECVGIAFQSLAGSDAENIGYVIPTPVIQHFLTDFRYIT